MNNLDQWRHLQKTAGWGGKGAVLAGLPATAIYALALLPTLTGGAAGYLLEKQNQPEKMDFRNIGKEHLLAAIRSQRAQTDKLHKIRQEREEARDPGSTDIGQTAARERHIG